MSKSETILKEAVQLSVDLATAAREYREAEARMLMIGKQMTEKFDQFKKSMEDMLNGRNQT